MTPDSIRSAIAVHINASWSSTYIVFPNREYNPSGAAWIRPVVKMGDTIEGEKGTDGLGLRSGVLMNSIFVPGNSGDKTALGYASTFELLFRRRNIGGIMFGEPNTREVGMDEFGYYHVMVAIPFYAWIGE